MTYICKSYANYFLKRKFLHSGRSFGMDERMDKGKKALGPRLCSFYKDILQLFELQGWQVNVTL